MTATIAGGSLTGAGERVFVQLTGRAGEQEEVGGVRVDLVAFLDWMAEPTASTRVRVGAWVLIFLGLFTVPGPPNVHTLFGTTFEHPYLRFTFG